MFSSNSSFICCDSSSSKCSLCISNDYCIYSFGFCKYSSHGFTKNKISIPQQIPNLINIKSISRGYYHCMCLNFNGDVYSFGRNTTGKLGINKTESDLEFSHIPHKLNLPIIKQISCGFNFTICLSEDGYLFSFGHNVSGQLGLGDNTYSLKPKQIPDFCDIEFILCYGSSTICKNYNNEFYSWGNNKNGQLGQGNFQSCNKPIQCNNWPDNIISIKSCGYHVLLLSEEGKLYSFGNNEYGQLGIKNKTQPEVNIPTLIEDIPEIKRIECGYRYSICIDINNNLWLFGFNKYGQLGLGDKEHRYKPILHPTLSNIIDISSGGNHTFVKTIDNKIYAFGNNCHSQLEYKH